MRGDARQPKFAFPSMTQPFHRLRDRGNMKCYAISTLFQQCECKVGKDGFATPSAEFTSRPASDFNL